MSSKTLALIVVLMAVPACAQQRGQYLSGLSANNSGVMPEPGLTYANLFYYSSSSRLKGPNGQGLPVTGQFAILVDNNVFMYVYKPKILGGYLESMADVPIANGSLAASLFASGRAISGGGGGIADTYFVPAQIGWHLHRLDIQTGYAFFAPTGRYTAGATNNVGVGYWTNAYQASATIYLTANKATSLNAFNIYSWSRQQPGTNITPGQNDSFDYSLLQVLPLTKGKEKTYLLQTGVIGYGQWQTSNSSGVPPAVAGSRYGVNAVGFTVNVLVPGKKLSIGTSAFWELGAYNTREGHVLMISGVFSF
ncbi:MAG TPA: transporter [Candidatus Angelobacter sp.]